MNLVYVYLFIHLESIDARFSCAIWFFFSSEAQTLLKNIELTYPYYQLLLFHYVVVVVF